MAGIAIVIGTQLDPWIGTWIYPAFSWIVIVVTAASAVEYVRAALDAVPEAERP